MRKHMLIYARTLYERAFAPRNLCNWETPHWYPARPRSPRHVKPVFLADDRGHLLPGVRRGAPAWKNYPTAWDYPKKLTREKIKELTQEPPRGRYLDWLPHVNKPTHSCPEDVVKRCKKIASGGQDENQHDEDYEPGCLVNPKERVNAPPLVPQEPSLQQLCDEKEIKSGTLEEKRSDLEALTDMKDTRQYRKHSSDREILPNVNYVPGFQYARKMHMDNLLHQPLPDTMAAKVFNKQRSKSQQDINIKPYSTNWIRNDFNGQRPVTSSGIPVESKSMDVLFKQRPATSGNEKNLKCVTPMNLAIQWDYRTRNPREEPKRPKHIDGSNGSMAPAVFSMVHSPNIGVDNLRDDIGKSQAIFSQNIPPDDCSVDRIVPRFDNDMSKNKRKEACDVPKCSQHSKYEKNGSVDGSIKMKERNKSAHKNNKNKENEMNIEKPIKRSGSCDGIHGCGSSNGSHKGSMQSGSLHRRKIKNAWSEEEKTNKINNNNNDSLVESFNKEKLHQSSPNLSKANSNKTKTETSSQRTQDTNLSSKLNQNINRPCMACDHKNDKVDDDTKKPEYKMAFKAGIPNSNGGSETKSTESNSKASIKIPKMKDPYSKKSYAIPTLAPPFSRWKDSSGYPEHWRLASIYQHAYKHPEARKHALLPAVFH